MSGHDKIGWTVETLEWSPWLETIHELGHTPEQIAQIEADVPVVKGSRYFGTLAHDLPALRERTALALRDGRGLREAWMLVSGSPIEHAGVRHALVTLEDVTELVRARSLLPMCAHCRRLRSDDHYWMTVEEYLKEHHDVDVSHGLCLDCARDVHGLAWNGE